MLKIGDKVRVDSHWGVFPNGMIINFITKKDDTRYYHVEIYRSPKEFTAAWFDEDELEKIENGIERARKALCDSK